MKSRAKLSSPLWSGLFMAWTFWTNFLRISTCSILPRSPGCGRWPPRRRRRRPPARRRACSVFPSSLPRLAPPARPSHPSPAAPCSSPPPWRRGSGGSSPAPDPSTSRSNRRSPTVRGEPRRLAPVPTPSQFHPPSPPSSSSVRDAATASGTRLPLALPPSRFLLTPHPRSPLAAVADSPNGRGPAATQTRGPASGSASGATPHRTARPASAPPSSPPLRLQPREEWLEGTCGRRGGSTHFRGVVPPGPLVGLRSAGGR